jgi:hypothetical protein
VIQSGHIFDSSRSSSEQNLFWIAVAYEHVSGRLLLRVRGKKRGSRVAGKDEIQRHRQ